MLSSQEASDCLTLRADELTEGDIIKHVTGDIWQVISEPEYFSRGICFEVLWLDIPDPNNTQEVCFAPELRFELVNYQPAFKEVAA